jgi:hypothetical protein
LYPVRLKPDTTYVEVQGKAEYIEIHLARHCPFYGQFLTRCTAMDASCAPLKADTDVRFTLVEQSRRRGRLKLEMPRCAMGDCTTLGRLKRTRRT